MNILRSPSPRPAAPPPQQPAPGFPFQGLNGAIFGQPPVPPAAPQQVFPQFGAPNNFPFWQQAPPPQGAAAPAPPPQQPAQDGNIICI